jgi:hypothetical protein
MTNKIQLRTIEEFMADYQPVYQPLYPLFLGKSQQYAEEVGINNFRRVTAVGDIRAKHITPKDTEIAQVSTNDSKKSFRKYFLANQYVQSSLQEAESVEDVQKQVLDEHQKQADELLLYGGSEDNGTTLMNNGLFYSGDANYILNSSAAIGDLATLHATIVGQLAIANQISGRKAVVYYGAAAKTKENSLYGAAVPVSFKSVLRDVLPEGGTQIDVPVAVDPATGSGVLIVNLDQVKLHYTTLPQLKDQGVNDEKMYVWSNFLMGSMMLECLAKGAIIRQPLTFSF